MGYSVKTIVRKKPTRFANISWGGSKTIGRNAAAKKIKAMRKLHQSLKSRTGGGALGYKAQHSEVQRAIKAAKKRKVSFAVNT